MKWQRERALQLVRFPSKQKRFEKAQVDTAIAQIGQFIHRHRVNAVVYVGARA
jgi:hypothetical protein